MSSEKNVCWLFLCRRMQRSDFRHSVITSPCLICFGPFISLSFSPFLGFCLVFSCINICLSLSVFLSLPRPILLPAAAAADRRVLHLELQLEVDDLATHVREHKHIVLTFYFFPSLNKLNEMFEQLFNNNILSLGGGYLKKICWPRHPAATNQ